MNNDTNAFSVKYDKPSHDIDTETYIQSLSALTTLLKEVNHEESSTGRISVNVIAQKEGSFDVNIMLKAITDLLSPVNIAYISGIVTIVLGLIEIKRIWHKADISKTIIDGDDVTIKDVKGNVVFETTRNTYNIYTSNQVVQDALSQNFRALRNDESIEAFKVTNKEKTVTIPREEFEHMGARVEVMLQEKEESVVSASMIVIKAVFEGAERKWEFLYNGNKISAFMKDEAFWSEINQGKRFGKGDEIIVDLKIIREYDPAVGAFLNREYQVISVREYHPRELREQMGLDDIS